MTEPEKRDVVTEARGLLAKVPTGMKMPEAPLLSKSLELLRLLADECESLRSCNANEFDGRRSRA